MRSLSVSMSLSATVPASVIVAGMDRSILPGPRVMTNICPSPTMTENEAKVSAACERPSVEAPPVNRMVASHTPKAVTKAQIHGLANRRRTALIRRAPRIRGG